MRVNYTSYKDGLRPPKTPKSPSCQKTDQSKAKQSKAKQRKPTGGCCIPHTILMDIEPGTVNSVRAGPFWTSYQAEQLCFWVDRCRQHLSERALHRQCRIGDKSTPTPHHTTPTHPHHARTHTHFQKHLQKSLLFEPREAPKPALPSLIPCNPC